MRNMTKYEEIDFFIKSKPLTAESDKNIRDYINVDKILLKQQLINFQKSNMQRTVNVS